VGEVQWTLFGRHNAENALAAVAAACAAGVDPARACAALRDFSGVRRRLERLATINGVSIYDDFAHHPTAIAATLGALRRHVGTARIVAILEPRSNTMKLGVHAAVLGPALAGADTAFVYQPERLAWDMAATLAVTAPRARVYGNIADIVAAVTTSCSAGDHIVVMSNGGFGDIHQQLLAALAAA